MKHQIRWILNWLATHANIVMFVVLLIVAGTWGFIALAGEVMEGDTHRFDVWAVQSLRDPADPGKPVGPVWLGGVGRDITSLGGTAVLVLVNLMVIIYLILVRKTHAVWLVIAAAVGATLISSGLKYGFMRDRPEVVPHLDKVFTPSFPSGHAMISSAVYLTLGALLTRLVPQRRLKVYFLGVALFLTLIIGVSRVYMGVHYPTDVLAGWSLGLVWAMICWLAARYLQRRGHVEKDHEGADAEAPTGRPAHA